MGRRKVRSAANNASRTSANRDRPAAAAGEGPLPNPPRPNKWLLTAAVLLQVLWTAFLLVLALRG